MRPLTIGWGAAGLALGWAAALCVFYAPWLAHYYPHDDDWALLAASQPGLAHPLSWWTEGLSTYFSIDGAYITSPFIRPLFNFTYWIVGLLAAPESSARIGLGVVAVVACALACHAAIVARRPAAVWLALAAGALLPLLPPFVPARIIELPYLPFDALAAALCVIAYAAYCRQRYALASVFLLAALLTKETAAPVAVALPAAYAWEQRATLLRDRRVLVQLVMLAAPVLCWLVLRDLAAPSLLEGSYAFKPTPSFLAKRLLGSGWRWPLWPQAQGGLAGPLVALAAANVALLTLCLAIMARRFWRERVIMPEEACFLMSYGCMLIVGRDARYGAVLWAFLLICAVNWLANPRSRAMAIVVMLAIVGDVAYGARTAWHQRDESLAFLRPFWQNCAEYTETLRRFGAGERVLVLEDRCTLASHISALTLVAGVKAQVTKLTDAYTDARRPLMARGCSSELVPDAADPTTFTFTSSCGLDVFITLQRGKHTTLQLGDGIVAEMFPSETQPGAWGKARVTVGHGTHLLWPDAAGNLQQRDVP